MDDEVVAQFIVVDNASRDGSAQLSIDWPKLLIDHVGHNIGFGRGCNRGARKGNAPYILFLNPDTRLTQPAISSAVAFMDQEKAACYTVAGVKLVDETGKASRNAARFPGKRTLIGMLLGLDMLWPARFPPLLMMDFDHETSREVDHVQGAFYLVRRSEFEAVQGFDEEFFVYFEDVDLSLRLHANGGKSYFLADTEAYHLGGGTSKQVKGLARYYGIEARMLYAQKHFGKRFNALHSLLTFALEPIATIAWYAYRYKGRHLGAAVKAFGLLYANAPRLLTRRPSRAAPFGRKFPIVSDRSTERSLG